MTHVDQPCADLRRRGYQYSSFLAARKVIPREATSNGRKVAMRGPSAGEASHWTFRYSGKTDSILEAFCLENNSREKVYRVI